MDTAVIAAIIGAVGGLIGVSVGVFFSRKIAIEAANISSKNAFALIREQDAFRASADIRASFAKIIAEIRSGRLHDNKGLSGAALAAVDTHTIEMERFRFYVTDKSGYDKACEEYKRMVYMRPINHGSNLHVTKFYIEKVNNILKYTKR